MTDRTLIRLEAIARRHGAGDDAPDLAADAHVWMLTRPRPLREREATDPFSCMARFVQHRALNFRKRSARLAPQCDVRVTYADRLVAREHQDERRKALATLTDAERALILAPRGTVTASDRVKRQRLLNKIRARLA